MLKILAFFMNIKELVTLLIALIGFLLSLWNFFAPLLRNRCNLQIECKDFATAPHLTKDGKMPMYLSLIINNKSALPISISRLFININQQTFEFTWIPQVVHQSRLTCKNTILDSTVVKTHPIPVQIPALNLTSGYFCVFVDSALTDEILLKTHCSITLHTNRSVKTYDLTLPQIATDI